MSSVEERFISLRLLKNLNTFALIHRGERYEINSNLLSHFSTTIAALLSQEPNTTSFEVVPIDGPMNQLINFFYGAPVSIDPQNYLFFLVVSEQLGIDILINRISKIEKSFFDHAPLSLRLSKTTFELKSDDSLGNFPSAEIARAFSKCDNDLLENVIDFLVDYAKRTDDVELVNYYFRMLPIDRLSSTKISTLISSGVFDSNILSSIFNPSSLNFSSSFDMEHVIIDPEGRDPMNGIIAFLKGRSSISPVLLGHISVNGKSDLSELFGSSKAVENSSVSTYYASKNEQINELVLSVSVGTIQISHYALRSWEDSRNKVCPKKWSLCVSSNGLQWTTVDERESDVFLESGHAEIFKLSRVTQPVAFIKIIQYDTWHRENKRLVLSGIEFFGRLHYYSRPH